MSNLPLKGLREVDMEIKIPNLIWYSHEHCMRLQYGDQYPVVCVDALRGIFGFSIQDNKVYSMTFSDTYMPGWKSAFFGRGAGNGVWWWKDGNSYNDLLIELTERIRDLIKPYTPTKLWFTLEIQEEL